MVSVDDYPVLATYAVLCDTGLSNLSGNTTVTAPFVYGSEPPRTYTGMLGTPATNTGTAMSQLDSLVDDVNNAISSPTALLGVVNSRTFTPGSYTTTSTTFLGTLTFNGPGQFYIQATDFTFTNVVMVLNDVSYTDIFWVAAGAINFSGTSPKGIFIAGTGITFTTGASVLGRLYAMTSPITFNGTSTVDATERTVCYVKGTLILTDQGFTPIENIQAGTKVVTRGKINGFIFVEDEVAVKPVRWISKFKVNKLTAGSRPICIKQHALGPACPFKDLYVSPSHSLLLNGFMVLAKDLVNGDTIYQDQECTSVVYYHLECDAHRVIVANGVLAESYLEAKNRHLFQPPKRDFRLRMQY